MKAPSGWRCGWTALPFARLELPPGWRLEGLDSMARRRIIRMQAFFLLHCLQKFGVFLQPGSWITPIVNTVVLQNDCSESVITRYQVL